MRRILYVLLIALLPITTLALDIGDRAPALDATAWINGEAVEPSKPDGKTTYIVEFWATWCPPCKKSIPHLSELQKKLSDQNVVIIGVTTEEPAVVKPFVEKLKMDYRVAIADQDNVAETWMEGVSGIPHAFIVNTNGMIVWAGHPMSEMDEALRQVLDGTFDPEKAAKKQSEEQKLQELLMSGDFDKALKQLDRMIISDKTNFSLYELKLGLLAQTEDYAAMRTTYGDIQERFADSPESLNTVAWIAATSPFGMADLKVAWDAANRASKLSERKDSAILDTLARVYYALGLLQEASKVQEEALSVAEGDEEKADIQRTLDFYRSAISVRTSILAQPAEAAP
jgi:thiol-disulfide isomerase/thioredoxin